MVGFTKRIVAVVDDDPRIRESVESLLESAGHTSMVFSSAEKFLQSGDLAGTSCLITDVRMPGMDGLELQRRVKMERSELPIIFITGHHDENIRQRALDHGAAGFLYKPFDVKDLLRAIETALRESPDEK